MFDQSWAYLIPPPAYTPTSSRTDTYIRWTSSTNEEDLLHKRINYGDFAIAVCDASIQRWIGVHLIANQ